MVNQIIKEHQEDIDRIKNNETTSKYVLSMLELEDKNQLHLRIERWAINAHFLIKKISVLLAHL